MIFPSKAMRDGWRKDAELVSQMHSADQTLPSWVFTVLDILDQNAEENGIESRQPLPGMQFCIGSTVWPGLSKLIEECGEVMQVAGKLMATGGRPDHWDGTDLKERITEELADLMAAAAFVAVRCGLDADAISERRFEKIARFEKWHIEQRGKT